MNVERSRLVGRSNNFNYRKYEEKQYHKYFYLIRKVKNWGLEPKFWRFFSVISKLSTTYCLAHLLTHIWWVQGKKLDDLGWPHRTINRKFKRKSAFRFMTLQNSCIASLFFCLGILHKLIGLKYCKRWSHEFCKTSLQMWKTYSTWLLFNCNTDKMSKWILGN